MILSDVLYSIKKNVINTNNTLHADATQEPFNSLCLMVVSLFSSGKTVTKGFNKNYTKIDYLFNDKPSRKRFLESFILASCVSGVG